MARNVNLNLSIELRPWTSAAMYVLALACLCACILSARLADWLSDKGAKTLAHYGVRYVVNEVPVSPPLLLTYQPIP